MTKIINLGELIQKVDDGREFGLQDTSEYREAFLNHRKDNIQPALEYLIQNGLQKRTVRIGDFGGGNAILGKYFTEILKEKKISFSFYNIDIDHTKMIEIENITNLVADIREYETEKKFDIMLSRHLTHYLSEDEKKKVMKNIYDSGEEDSIYVLTQPIASNTEERRFLNDLYSLLADLKGCNRKYWDTEEELIGYLEEAGFRHIKTYTKYDVFYTLNGFYKLRYKLDTQQLERIEKRLEEGLSIEGVEKRSEYGTVLPSLVISAEKGGK